MACIWNYETKELLCELKGHTDGGLCAEFSPDGRRVATASEDYSIKLWELSGDGMPPAAAKKAVRRKGALPTLKVGE
jgi:WD40 repeat protein